MLSKENNELLTRVGPGTAMGSLIRRFWLPVILSSELPDPDGTPIRIRIMGEDLVAFRNTQGRVGILEEACPHRGASLALGANEECGLRCIYHGWKFDVDGKCLERPSEPEPLRMVHKIRAVAYPTREAAGMIWVYMGPGDQPPPEFPNFQFLSWPASHVAAFKLLEDCNYAQAMEGTIDSAHAGFLHRSVPFSNKKTNFDFETDLAPKLEVELTKYGLRYGAEREIKGKNNIRVTEVVLPFMSFIPPLGVGPIASRRLLNIFVPRDDYSTWNIQFFFDENKPVDVDFRIEEGGIWLDGNFRKLRNIDNWYLQDRVEMKQGQMSGIKGILTQDHAVCESQGRISDRTREHLGASDLTVVIWRRIMLQAARALSTNGALPSTLTANFPWEQIKASNVTCTPNLSWKEAVPLAQEFIADIVDT
jgi:phthalate 4,5-dioxygenase